MQYEISSNIRIVTNFTAYQIHEGVSPVIEDFARWNPDKQIFIDLRSTPITARRRQDLAGTQLKGAMVILNEESLNHMSDYRDIHKDTIAKMNHVQTKHMVDFLNATVKYSIVNNWGYRDKNTGDWSGMTGQLVRHEADLGATACFFTIERIPYVDYVAMTTKSKSIFVFRSPKLSFTDNIFLLPFSNAVWLCLIFIIPVVGASLALVTYAEFKLQVKSYVSTLFEVVYVCFKIIEGFVG